MKCPSCDHELTAVEASGVSLDVCRSGCGGIWFDRDELFKFDEPAEAAGCDFLTLGGSHTEQTKRTVSQQTESQQTRPKQCPRCTSEVLVRQFLDHRNAVEIDQCWSCGGIWFDAGELQTLRSQYATFEERSKAANEYCDRIINDYEEAAGQRSKETITEFQLAHGNRFRAFVTQLRELLGFRDDDMDV